MLVYCTSEGVFKIWNSLHDPFAIGTTNVFLSCLAGCMRLLSGFTISGEEVGKAECRNQGATLDYVDRVSGS